MDFQRLRNITTGRLHTEIGHVYEDLEYLTGQLGIMTHNLPNAIQAILPILKKRAVISSQFWDEEYSPKHNGEIEIAPLSLDEITEFWENYNALPHPFSKNWLK